MSEKVVEKDKVISFIYSITDEAGKTVERSDVPLEYIHGSPTSQVFPKVEAALEGRRMGDVVEVVLAPEEGFGPHDPELTFTEDLDNVPQEHRYVGARMRFENELGEGLEMLVTRIEDGKLTFDANHPYAGKIITFHITIDNIRDARPEELGAASP
ncbi:MAG: peptidylprolyl isomerase [Gammaproteobacteria bacterium]|nr:peptidylprolyl isomerase [Gammaproteobacteria bacterium]